MGRKVMSRVTSKVRRVARIQTRVLANAVAKRLPEQRRRSRFGPYAFTYPSRSLVGRAVAEGLTWDAHLIPVLATVPPNGLVCEVGSNIGASLLTMARAREDVRFVC